MNSNDDYYKQKYLKYKAKYDELKRQLGGIGGPKAEASDKNIKNCEQKRRLDCATTIGCKWIKESTFRGNIERCVKKECNEQNNVTCVHTPGCKLENGKCTNKM